FHHAQPQASLVEPNQGAHLYLPKRLRNGTLRLKGELRGGFGLFRGEEQVSSLLKALFGPLWQDTPDAGAGAAEVHTDFTGLPRLSGRLAHMVDHGEPGIPGVPG